MNDLDRLKVLHLEERAARERWQAVRDRRTALIIAAKHAGVPVSEIADATELTTGRIYNIVRAAEGTAPATEAQASHQQLRDLTHQMEQESAAATALARQRNEAATSLVHSGATTTFLSAMLGVNVDSLRNWLYQ